MSSVAVMSRPFSRMAFSSDSACCTLRGKPSSRKPSAQSGPSMQARIIPMITSSGTRSPRSMYSLACLPSSVPFLTCSRSMSPVAMYGRWKSSVTRAACVPLPAPGGPSRMRLSSDMRAMDDFESAPCSRRAKRGILLQEALVVAHHQLRLELFHRVQRDADHDQQRRAAEEEVRVGLGDQDRRQRRDRGKE